METPDSSVLLQKEFRSSCLQAIDPHSKYTAQMPCRHLKPFSRNDFLPVACMGPVYWKQKTIGLKLQEEQFVMESSRKTVSIRKKMFFFIITTVLVVAFGTSAIAFTASANQIDRYYKQNTADNARNFASFVDAEYIAKRRTSIESEEYQKLRTLAEEAG